MVDATDRARKKMEVPGGAEGARARLADESLAHRLSSIAYPDAKDEPFRRLQEKKILHSMHQGPDLDVWEKAKLQSKEIFKDRRDENYRRLQEQKYLAMHELAKPLSAEDDAKLSARFSHPNPNANRERKIREREILTKHPNEDLKRELAWRDSKRAFPKEADEEYRRLDERRRLAKDGLADPLDQRDEAHLLSKYNYASNERLRAFDEQRRLAKHGLEPQLAEDDARTLRDYDLRHRRPIRRVT